MKKTVWLNKANSFKEAQKFDAAYYRRLSSKERIETIQLLRENHFKSTGMSIGENGKRLQRVVRIIELKQISNRTQKKPDLGLHLK
ncbi:MAG: hypothetical protein ACYS0I_09665 [Planctomycetota bacterium]|jgi:hypothetical protein